MTDILVYVSCKFEMYIFKIAQVINENVRIAFLYVLSIFRSCVKYYILSSRMFLHFWKLSDMLMYKSYLVFRWNVSWPVIPTSVLSTKLPWAVYFNVLLIAFLPISGVSMKRTTHDRLDFFCYWFNSTNHVTNIDSLSTIRTKAVI